ncbi:MAG: TerD family protein [Ignavibacteria bacterium]|nr:TerD family protein [Ignavibacteria bacterium]MBL7991368.1 TerD family protein [Candidatus Kapabacteria bacterium]
MAISLQKGGRFNLTKKEPSLKKIFIGLGWDVKPGHTLDLDASVFMLGAGGKIPQDEYFVFYNNLKSPDGAVQHTGDNRTGVGDGDDEVIMAYLPMLNENIYDILMIITIHDAASRRQNFSMIQNAYIRLVDVESNREIVRYDLAHDYPTSTEVEFGRLTKVNGEWEFVASGTGTQTGLQGYVDKYA